MTDRRPQVDSSLYSNGWLIAAHALLCLSQLGWHVARYPIGRSLYFWWLSPLDIAALCAVTVLYLTAARWGFSLNALIGGIESLALVYLAIKTVEMPITAGGDGIVALYGATAVLARIPIGWVIALNANKVRPRPRGCE